MEVEDLDEIPYVDSSRYNWPAVEEDDDEYCHLDRFRLFDRTTNEMVDLTVCALGSAPKNKMKLFCVGALVPAPDSGRAEKLTRFPVEAMSIDFGQDANRGFWLQDEYKIWYKLVEADKSYAEHAYQCLQFSKEFCNLMDIVTGKDAKGKPYSKLNDDGSYACNKTIDFLYKDTGHAFDIDLLLGMGNLLHRQLDGAVADCTLLSSCVPSRKGHSQTPKKSNAVAPSSHAASSSSNSGRKASSKPLTANALAKSLLRKGSSSAYKDDDFSDDEIFVDKAPKQVGNRIKKNPPSNTAPAQTTSLAAADDFSFDDTGQDHVSSDNAIETMPAPFITGLIPKRAKLANKLAADWIRPDVQPIREISISEVSSKTIAEVSNAKAKENLIKKRPKNEFVPSTQSNDGGRSGGSVELPRIGQILKAKVAYIESYGLFMQLPSPYGTGQVHNSQVTYNSSIDIKTTVKLKEEFYVKVLKIFTLKGIDKIDLSIKYCDQVGGADLDPDGSKYERESARRGGEVHDKPPPRHRPAGPSPRVSSSASSSSFIPDYDDSFENDFHPSAASFSSSAASSDFVARGPVVSSREPTSVPAVVTAPVPAAGKNLTQALKMLIRSTKVEKAAKINSISQTADIVHPPSQPVPTREPPPTYSAAPLDPRKRDHDINMTAALNFIRNNEDKINQNALLSSAPPVEVGIKSLALQRLIRSQQAELQASKASAGPGDTIAPARDQDRPLAQGDQQMSFRNGRMEVEDGEVTDNFRSNNGNMERGHDKKRARPDGDDGKWKPKPKPLPNYNDPPSDIYGPGHSRDDDTSVYIPYSGQERDIKRFRPDHGGEKKAITSSSAQNKRPGAEKWKGSNEKFDKNKNAKKAKKPIPKSNKQHSGPSNDIYGPGHCRDDDTSVYIPASF